MTKQSAKPNPFRYLLFATVFVFCVFNVNLNAQINKDAEKQGAEIYEKYQAALGGKENLSKIKTVETITETKTSNGSRKETSIKDLENKKSYTKLEYSDGRVMESGLDGSRQWMRMAGRDGYMGGEPDDFIPVSKLTKLPNQKVDGKDYLVVEEERASGKKRLFFDPQTFLLVRRETEGNFNGNSIKITNIYSDYRKVGDILVPFVETSENSYVGGITTKTIVSIRHNVEVDADIFELNPKKKDPPKTGKPTAEELKSSLIKNTIYQDENGNTISENEFRTKIENSNYGLGPNRLEGGTLIRRLKKNEVNIIAAKFTGTLLDGSTVKLDELSGKVVVLNFWFTACAPCLKEMPELNSLVTKYKENRDVEFYSVTYNTRREVSDFLAKRAFDYKHIVDAQTLIDQYQNPSYPTHIVIDRSGKIVLTQLGYSEKIKEKLIETIDAALAKKTI